MESVLGRYRNLTILVGVLFLQVLGLAVQVKRSADAQNTRLIRIWAVGAITPFERGLVWAQNGTSNLLHSYLFLRGVRAENRQLKEQIEKLRLDQVRLSEDAEQAHRLQSLLGFKEQIIGKPLPAQVIGSSGSDLSQSIYIDKGSNDGVAPDMAVITAGGIVGKVLRVYPSTSLVLMINDQSSGVGALLEKTRLQGVLRGTPTGELMLERVMSDETVAPGDTVLSSGGDQIFPKGLPVGTVSKVSPGKEMFLSIKVKPAADLSRLEEVLVVTQKQEREPPVTQSGERVRAADILAQRLPSVPDKPATVGGATPAASGGVKLPPNGAGKPVTGAGTKLAPGALPAAGGNAASRGVAQPAPGEVLKNVVQKTAPGDAATNDAGSAAGSPAVLSDTSNATPNATPSNSANSPAKPATASPKPSQSNPPAASDDNPH
jgi:rod shape-determining protein MreC